MNETFAEKKFSFTGHKGPVYALEQGSHPHLFYSAGGDHLVVEWNLLTRETGTVILNIPHTIYSLKYHAEKNLLFAGQAQGGIHVVDLEQKQEIKLLAFHKGPVFDLAFSKEHNLLLSAGGDGFLIATALPDFTLVKAMHLSDQKIRSVVLSPDGNSAIVGCQDGTIAIISLPDLKLGSRFQAHKAGFSVNTSLFISDGSILISGSRDACLNVFDAKNNFALLESVPAHNFAIYHIVRSPDNKYFATASRDKTIKIWDSENMKVLARFDKVGYDGHVNSVNRLLWSSFNSLLSASDDRSIMEWALK